MANLKHSVVIGSVNGRFSEVFGKLTALHTKQNFAFAIIAGSLFRKGDNEELVKLLSGEIQVPLPTYFTIPAGGLPEQITEILEKNDGELCSNLSALGRKSSIKTAEGFRIVSIGGAHAVASDLDEPMDQYSAIYNDSDVAGITKGIEDADLLVTSEWPAQIQSGAAAYQGETPPSSTSISDLCGAIKPRYHFSSSDGFYERAPFAHNGPTPRSTTRFISLAPFGNAAKEKWIYAFSLERSAQPPQKLPPGCTDSPFTNGTKRKLESQQADYNSYRYANGNGYHQERDYGPRKRQRNGQRNRAPPTPQQCYFCLSNPECNTHMIGSIGNDVYVTTAKGPLTKRETFPDLGFPGHVLLIPLQHAPTMSAIPDAEARKSTINEMQRYRAAMQNMLVEKSKDESGRAKLGAVTWEISRNSGVHLHWQFLPLPVDLIQRGLVEAAFDAEAENLNYPKFAKTPKDMEEIEEGNFFKVMIWSETLRKEMAMPLDGDFRFDLQFGRRAMGMLLEMPARAHWKDCEQTKEEEEADAAAFKEAFKPWDFSLEE